MRKNVVAYRSQVMAIHNSDGYLRIRVSESLMIVQYENEAKP